MQNRLQQLILNIIMESENATGDVFGSNSSGTNSFQNSDMRGDFAANNASKELKKTRKRSRKKILASKIMRRLPIMDPKQTF